MSNVLFSIFPNERFVDLGFINTAGNSVNRCTLMVPTPGTTICSTTAYPAQAPSYPRIPKGNPTPTRLKAGKGS